MYRFAESDQLQTLFQSQVDCWSFGNRELQGFTKIEDKLWITNCENVVQCLGNNCISKRVEIPEFNLFEIDSQAIEVINDNLVWIGYRTKGLYVVKWDELQ